MTINQKKTVFFALVPDGATHHYKLKNFVIDKNFIQNVILEGTGLLPILCLGSAQARMSLTLCFVTFFCGQMATYNLSIVKI